METLKQFVVVMYYPIDLAKAVIAEEGISEVDVREKIELKYPKWKIEKIKEVTSD